MKKIVTGLLLCGLSLMSNAQVEVENSHDRFFPIWGKEARELGYDLPNPYGFSVIYMGMRQDLDVQSIELDFQNPIIGGIVDNLDISARDAKVDVDNVTFRADVWVFPFLNVYGLIGHTKGSVRAKADIGAVIPGRPGLPPFIPPTDPTPIELNGIDIGFDYEGTTYGGGFVLAGGYERFFAMVDTNYTYTKLDIVDGETKAFITAPRVGYEFTVYERPLRFWVGAMYQNIEQTIRGDIDDILDLGDLGDLVGPGKFTVKQKGADPWTYTSGFNMEMTKSWDLIFEVGFGNNTSVMAGSGYRF